MEATVHLLDMAEAVGGVQPSEKALTATRDLLIAVPDPTAAIEVLTGRAAPPAASPQPGESPDWVEIRNALAGKLNVLGALLEGRTPAGDNSPPAPPPRSVWRKP